MKFRAGKFSAFISATLLLMLSVNTSVYAWMRMYETPEVVTNRSTLIVIGQLDARTIRLRPKVPSRSNEQHQAALIVKEVLKGHLSNVEKAVGALNIFIGYGLQPVVSTGSKQDWVTFPRGAIQVDRTFPPGSVQLWDSGTSTPIVGANGFQTIADDLTQPHIWFLRTREQAGDDYPDPDLYGICNPEDIDDISLKPLYEALLSPDPGKFVKLLLHKHPELKASVEAYEERARKAQRLEKAKTEIAQILSTPEPHERPMLLIKYLSDADFDVQVAAQKALIKCGPDAGPAILAFMDSGKDSAMVHSQAIGLLGKIGYAPAVPKLAGLLRRHNQYWREHDLGKPDVADAENNRQISAEDPTLVYVLGRIGGPEAKAVLEETMSLWKSKGGVDRIQGLTPEDFRVIDCRNALGLPRPLTKQEEDQTKEKEIAKKLIDRLEKGAPTARYNVLNHYLNIDGQKGKEYDFSALKEFTFLKGLQILNVPFTDADLGYVTGLEQLEYIYVPSQITGKGLSRLSSLKNLRCLTLANCDIDGARLDIFPNLEVLSVYNDKKPEHLFNDTSLSDLAAGSPHIKQLDLRNTAVTGKGLSKFSELETLEIHNSEQLTETITKEISGSKSLRYLRLYNDPVSLQGIHNLDHLQEAELGSSQINDAALGDLAALPELTLLNLNCTLVTDAGMAKLSSARKLQYLRIRNTKVTGRGLADLKEIRTLKEVAK